MLAQQNLQSIAHTIGVFLDCADQDSFGEARNGGVFLLRAMPLRPLRQRGYLRCFVVQAAGACGRRRSEHG